MAARCGRGLWQVALCRTIPRAAETAHWLQSTLRKRRFSSASIEYNEK